MVRDLFRPAVLLAGWLLAVPAGAAAPPALADYLPEGVDYDPAVPKPSEVLGFEVGEWHVRHDLLVAYMRAVAEASPRVVLEETGRTHEARPLILLTISDADNIDRLDDIRRAHLRRSDPAQPAEPAGDEPVVVHLGYSVHGDEASGANASLVVAYHLAAARDLTTRRWLRESVVLLDPSLNPDGLSRFAQWVNMHRGEVLVADGNHREHNQHWPSGRTNHYWFDLNRDWLLAQHPETRARLGTFHRWRPNVHTDHHEMGTNSTFFFQPGVPSRKNPLTPDENVALTAKIAAYHAGALDRRGRLYYTEETFDDFYYGKGSTYPDVHGAVGILFEQASARGHLQESDHGPLSFPFAIENQVAVSMSTLEAAVDLRADLLDYQARFYRDAFAEAERGAVRGWIFGDGGDPARANAMIEVLDLHRIEVGSVTRPVEIDGRRFSPGAAWTVAAAQPQGRLARALFETVTEFADATFYDVSTWTFPLAFGLPFAELDAAALRTAAPRAAGDDRPLERATDPAATGEPVAWAFDWDSYWAPRALDDLLAAGVHVRVATEPFVAATAAGPRRFELGAIVIPRGLAHEASAEQLGELLVAAGEMAGVTVHALSSGLTGEGIDLGSPSLEPLTAPAIALAVGPGVSAYEAGQAWHLLDQRLGVAVSLLDRQRIGRGRDALAPYSHLILVDGDWGRMDDRFADAVEGFVKDGGVLLAVKRAAMWAERSLLDPSESGEDAAAKGDAEPPERRPYGSYRADRAVDLVAGAIFAVDLDPTHPLAYGYRERDLPVFRNSPLVFGPEPDAYTTVAAHTEAPLLSGYASDENVEKIAGTPALTARRLGNGLVVRYAFDPNFRAFWYGTTKLFVNPIFFGSVVRPTAGNGRRR